MSEEEPKNPEPEPQHAEQPLRDYLRRLARREGAELEALFTEGRDDEASEAAYWHSTRPATAARRDGIPSERAGRPSRQSWTAAAAA